MQRGIDGTLGQRSMEHLPDLLHLEGLQGGGYGQSLPAFTLHGACSAAERLQVGAPVGSCSLPWIEAL